MAFKKLKLVPDNTKIDFIGLRYFAYALSITLTLLSIGSFLVRGLNFGIDFTGGTLIEMALQPDANNTQQPQIIDETVDNPYLPQIRAALSDLNLGAVSIQEFGSSNDFMIRIPQQHGDLEAQNQAVEEAKNSLNDAFKGQKLEYRRVEYVGPQVGDELKKTGFFAIALSMIGVMAYVWLRFEWRFAVSSVLALFHDIIMTLGLFSLFNIPFDLATLAAVLMVAGYSTNDTVVVFDRIRENLLKYRRMPLSEILNLTVNQTLSRTTMTSFTVLLALLSLWIFGGEVIRGFIFALFFGILFGTYSSIFVASPLLMILGLNRQVMVKKDTKTAD
jgi:preprotein translocase SecF subunit